LPAADLQQLVRSAVERNVAIPAQLDAYSQFLDSPIGELELNSLDEVFVAIQNNLSQRFPVIASQRTAANVKNDVKIFLASANQDVERVKSALRAELLRTSEVVVQSMVERFSRANSDERWAIDATLRLIRRSSVEPVFRTELGKPLSTAGQDFTRFFLSVRAEAPGMRELRYENLVIEKGIYNKLLLKSKNQDFSIWVPSFYAKEQADDLISKIGLSLEGVLGSRLKEMKTSGALTDYVRNLLGEVTENSGLIPKNAKLPVDLNEFVNTSLSEQFNVVAPIGLDEISQFLLEEREERERKRLETEAQRRREQEEENQRVEIARRRALLERRQHRQAQEIVQESRFQTARVGQSAYAVQKTADSIYLGKTVDLEQFLKLLSRRVQEQEIAAQLKPSNEYYLTVSAIKSKGVAIVGSSGSGKSTSTKRILDGLGSSPDLSGLIVIDPKGEHRGVAWKHQWQVYAFAADSQAKEFEIPSLLPPLEDKVSEDSEILADVLQEWCLETSVTCTEQQRARIASVIRSQLERGNSSTSIGAIISLLSKESDLFQISQKMMRALGSKLTAQKIFSANKDRFPKIEAKQNTLFDLSGRGLKDPTTKEERVVASFLLLKFLESVPTGGSSILVVEDSLDRFKSGNLRKRCLSIVSSLKERNKNSIVATSKSQVRDFVGNGCIEIVHRLSGEKVINEELSGFNSGVSISYLQNLVGFFPRGYALVSRVGDGVPASAVKVEPVQFAGK
jgi:hypothetical protein